MLLADRERTCDAVRRDRRACREQFAKQRGTLAELAALEQRFAQLQEEELQLLAGLADCAVDLGRRLIEILINAAQGGRLRSKEREITAQAASEWADSSQSSI